MINLEEFYDEVFELTKEALDEGEETVDARVLGNLVMAVTEERENYTIKIPVPGPVVWTTHSTWGW